MHDTILKDIEIGLAGLELDCAQAAPKLARYVAQLARWNKTYNLTAVRRPQDMVARHLMDSLSVLPWLCGPRVLDVGSGAGLPGIPLAVARPDMNFVLIDSNAKRTRFLLQMRSELALENVTVEHARVENLAMQSGNQVLFDSVISRAFAGLADFLTSAGYLCARHGRVLAMKGKYPEAELNQLPAGFELLAVHRLLVPGLDGERHLVHLEPAPAAEAESGILSRYSD